MQLTIPTTLKRHLHRQIEQMLQEWIEQDRDELYEQLDIWISDDFAELMADAALNIIIAQHSVQAYMKKNKVHAT